MNQAPLFEAPETGHPANSRRVPSGAQLVPSSNPNWAPGQTPVDKEQYTDGCPVVPSFGLPSDSSKILTSNHVNSTRAGSQVSTTGHHWAPGRIPATVAALKKTLGAPGWRGLTPHRCRVCKQIVCTGLDADCCAGQADIDWTPLDAAGEIAALLQGRRTYQMRREDTHLVILGRTVRIIRARPPGGTDWCGPYDVVPAHRCWAAPLPTIDTRLITPTPDPTTTDHCPF